ATRRACSASAAASARRRVSWRPRTRCPSSASAGASRPPAVSATASRRSRASRSQSHRLGISRRFVARGVASQAVQSRGIHHLDLVVSNVDRSKAFYSALLRGLGWAGVLELEGERGEAIWYLQAADTWLGLREKQSDAHPVPYDRYGVGVHHVAFEASARDDVDRCWAWVLTQNVDVESAPKEF